MVLLARIALLVAIGDYVTKAAAAEFVAREPTVLTGWLRLAVVHNDQGAFGLSVGEYTWQLNLALTLSAIALMLPVNRDLAAIDRHAPRALGLIVGGALGNLISLIFSPNGVVDFIALSTSGTSSLVLNVADVAAYTGLALICRTGFLIVDRLRTDLRLAGTATVHHAATTRPRLHLEREVRREIIDDRSGDAPTPPSARDRPVVWPASITPPRPRKAWSTPRVIDLPARHSVDKKSDKPTSRTPLSDDELFL